MRRFAPALILAALASAMLAWTWGSWGDVQVDYGGEVYAAWRVSRGATLYRDVAYFTGPLSPWLNAALFRLFGTGIWTLFLANLVLAGFSTALVWALLRRSADAFTATAGGALFLVLFAFGQFEYLNDSNYLAPYSHEVVHATPLALLALLALARGAECARTGWFALAGLCLGLVALTKAEYTLALGAAGGAALLLQRARPKAWASFALAALLPPLFAWSMLARELGAREALLGVLGAWRYVFDTRITELAFYRWVMGTDRAGANLARMLEIAAAESAVLGAGWLAARRLGRTPALAAWGAGIALGLLLVLLVPIAPATWLELARPWPLYAGLALLALGWRAWKRRGALDAGELLYASFALFAALLLAKMVLNARVQMYGFALALPATLLVLLLVAETVPRWIAARGGSFVLARALGCGALLALVLGHLRVMQAYQARPLRPVGTGRDELRSDARGEILAAALRELEAKLKPGESFVVLPEGVLLNYLARVPAPVRYLNYMPPELLMFGEERMLAELATAAPAAVVLVHKPTAEYGFPWFGTDYGRGFGRWLNETYSKGALFGDEPLRPQSRFGARVLWRKDLGAR